MEDRVYDYRMRPRRVTIKNISTGEIETFPSIYKAAKAYNRDPKTILLANGKNWRKQYEIKIE